MGRPRLLARRGRGAARADAGGHRVQAVVTGRTGEPEGHAQVSRRLPAAEGGRRVSCHGRARGVAHGRDRHGRRLPRAADRGPPDPRQYGCLVGVLAVGAHARASIRRPAGGALAADRPAQRARTRLGAGVRPRRRPGADRRRAGHRADLRRHAGQGLRRDPRKRRSARHHLAAAQRRRAAAGVLLRTAADQRAGADQLHRVPVGVRHPLFRRSRLRRRRRARPADGHVDEDVQRRRGQHHAAGVRLPAALRKALG